MHKKAFMIAMLTASVAAVATTVAPIGARQSAAVETKAASMVPVPAAQPAARPAAPAFRGDIAALIARWNSLRQSDSHPFPAYASFLASHRGWPGEAAMRRAAERQIDPNRDSPNEVIAYFSALPALTNTGHARHALALAAAGRPDEARAAALEAWHGGAIPQADEERLLSQFGGSFTQADHDRRIDALLSGGAPAAAQRMLPLASAEQRPVIEARLALQTRAPDAPSRVQALGQAATANPGLLIDRAAYLRETGQPLAARQLLAQPRSLAGRPADPKKWMETQLLLARGAANDNQWQMAYAIASQVDDIYPAGTDVSQRPFGERDDYTNLTWLAGITALQRLGRPGDAIGMFERYARGAQTPQTQTKGLYWAGRAAQAAGQQDRANAFYREAAKHFDQFYGQLSAERIGVALPAPNVDGPAQASHAERLAFNNRDLVQAVRFLRQSGSWRDQTEFLRALAAEVKSDSDRRMAAELAQELGRPDLGVMVARQARSGGSTDYKRWGFPEVQVPASHQRHWTMVHAITRQESQFDREAVSHAGARGLMQLMPGTARETATRLGLPYDLPRLTRDTGYNVMLGSTYFAGLLDQWGGNYPLAIASYNAGPGNVRRWVRENGDPRLPSVDTIDWIEAIPFFETRNYVQRVLENAVVYDLMHPSRAGSPDGSQRLSFYLGSRRGG